MSLFIAWPWLAVAPAIILFLLYWRSRRVVILVSAAAWLGYGLYEYGMKIRWLCSGECNIRVDLLLIYPFLLLLSAAALYAALARRGGKAL